MANIDFPNSPSNGTSFSAAGKTWTYNGTVWVLNPNTASKTAYDIAVENGFVGTESQWLASLVGADGEQGPAGAPTRSIRSVSSSTTLQSGDLNQAIRFTGTSAQVLTVNDVLTAGTSVEIIQDNSGSVEFQSGAGVTLLSSSGIFRARGQNSVVTLRCVASGQYRITGDVVLVDPISATGGTITTSGGYTYHTFTTSGTLSVSSGTQTAEVLVIAGGGSGGGVGTNMGAGAGGGAGGLLYSTLAVTPGSYSVTVGAGGAAPSWGTSTQGSNGNNSSIGSILALGGGGGGRGGGSGGGGTGAAGSSGGSGGGGGYSDTVINAGGAGTAGQGFAGGVGHTGPNYGAGGGGGAGGVGTGGDSGPGGPGVNTYSAWGLATSTGQDIAGVRWYAGGGGGGREVTGPTGAGGNGGGGRGALNSGSGYNADPGTTNTGGGGGGASNSSRTAGSGGSGIVIVRYLTNG